jgi:hypothetical protein
MPGAAAVTAIKSGCSATAGSASNRPNQTSRRFIRPQFFQRLPLVALDRQQIQQAGMLEGFFDQRRRIEQDQRDALVFQGQKAFNSIRMPIEPEM